MCRRSLLVFVVLFGCAHAFAQTGCTDSPECPTAVLAAVGVAGATAGRWALGALGRRKR